ncbi:hypothetical protein HPQ58_00185, partial [Vibrio parahaemolyticus]|nr:hypothetical protein [Vibrio parahaemolyticus]
RNMAAHGRLEPSTKEVISSVTTIEAFEKFLLSLDKEAKAVIEKERLAKARQEQSEQIKILDMFGDVGA